MSRVEAGRRETAGMEIWRDPGRPAQQRVEHLLSRMTLEEKLARLTSVWVGAETSGNDVAPMPGEVSLPLRGSFWLHGPARAVGSERILDTPVEKRG